MERSLGRSGSSRVITTKKGISVGVKDATTERDQNARFCNRIGCSGRIKYISQNPRTEISEKGKCDSPSLHSPNGNKIIANSSSSSNVLTRGKGSNLDSKRKLSSRLESNPSESSQSGDSKASKSKSSLSRGPTRQHPGSVNQSNVPSNDRSQKLFQKKPESNNENRNSASSTPVGRNSTLNTNNRSRLGLKNLKCNSVGDLSSASSSSSQSQSIEKNVTKKRSTVGNSTLSSRGIETTSTEGNSTLSSRGREKMAVNGHRLNSASAISSSTSAIFSSSSRGSRYISGKVNNGAASVSKQRSTNVNNSRMRLLSNRQNGNNSSSESANRASHFPDSELRVNVGWESSPVHNANGSSSSWSSYSRSSSNYDNRRYNMDSEVLLALQRLEQGEELTSEQFRLLEGSYLLSDFNWSDQHIDMRMDIDNMSYEELLALGEMIGTVSTALPEEKLSQCICRCIYEATPSEVKATESGSNGDGIKCSICQEEYVEGDELGKLVECKHDYHMSCINEWLRLKNWCPICKADLKEKLSV